MKLPLYSHRRMWAGTLAIIFTLFSFIFSANAATHQLLPRVFKRGFSMSGAREMSEASHAGIGVSSTEKINSLPKNLLKMPTDEEKSLPLAGETISLKDFAQTKVADKPEFYAWVVQNSKESDSNTIFFKSELRIALNEFFKEKYPHYLDNYAKTESSPKVFEFEQKSYENPEGTLRGFLIKVFGDERNPSANEFLSWMGKNFGFSFKEHDYRYYKLKDLYKNYATWLKDQSVVLLDKAENRYPNLKEHAKLINGNSHQNSIVNHFLGQHLYPLSTVARNDAKAQTLSEFKESMVVNALHSKEEMDQFTKWLKRTHQFLETVEDGKYYRTDQLLNNYVSWVGQEFGVDRPLREVRNGEKNHGSLFDSIGSHVNRAIHDFGVDSVANFLEEFYKGTKEEVLEKLQEIRFARNDPNTTPMFATRHENSPTQKTYSPSKDSEHQSKKTSEQSPHEEISRDPKNIFSSNERSSPDRMFEFENQNPKQSKESYQASRGFTPLGEDKKQNIDVEGLTEESPIHIPEGKKIYLDRNGIIQNPESWKSHVEGKAGMSEPLPDLKEVERIKNILGQGGNKQEKESKVPISVNKKPYKGTQVYGNFVNLNKEKDSKKTRIPNIRVHDKTTPNSVPSSFRDQSEVPKKSRLDNDQDDQVLNQARTKPVNLEDKLTGEMGNSRGNRQVEEENEILNSNPQKEEVEGIKNIPSQTGSKKEGYRGTKVYGNYANTNPPKNSEKERIAKIKISDKINPHTAPFPDNPPEATKKTKFEPESKNEALKTEKLPENEEAPEHASEFSRKASMGNPSRKGSIETQEPVHESEVSFGEALNNLKLSPIEKSYFEKWLSKKKSINSKAMKSHESPSEINKYYQEWKNSRRPISFHLNIFWSKLRGLFKNITNKFKKKPGRIVQVE